MLSQAGGAAADLRDKVVEALRPYETVDGVRLPGSFWLVSATRP
jgi:hypothetical protein